MTPQLMTLEQAFNLSMNEHPSRYSALTLSEAKMKYYGQIFNVIGNGFSNLEDFTERHTINNSNQHLLSSFPDKYIGTTPLYYAYTQVSDFHGRKMGEHQFMKPGVYTQKELDSMPDVIHAVQSNKKYKEEKNHRFYPNFTKQYSMAWKYINELDKSWTLGALEFYKAAQLYFKSAVVQNYSSASPAVGDEAGWRESIAAYESNFEQYKKEGQSQEDYFAKISKEYELPYNGNTKEFIEARWAKEHKRINDFLAETIDMLEKTLEPENTQKIKMK